MKLVFLGTGTPMPSPERAGSGIAVILGDEILVIDCGPGTTHRFMQAGLPFRKVANIFLTHHHFDHNVSYAHLVLEGWLLGRKGPLRVYGPRGTKRISRLLFDEIYGREIKSRKSLGGQGSGAASPLPQAGGTPGPETGMTLLNMEAEDIDGGAVIHGSNWKMSAVRVDHECPPYTLGYRLEADGKAVVFSSDTAPCPSLVGLCRGADLLIHEAFWPQAQGAWKVLLDQAPVSHWAERWGHTPPEEVGRLAVEAGVKNLVLTHLMPGEDEAALASMVRKHYGGKLTVAHDLFELTP
jgi:ribonuclease BN (tRNA processing enzyme)